MRYLFHVVITVILTGISQIGGIIYLTSILTVNKKKTKYKIKRFVFFTTFYILITFFITPNVAPLFGREKIIENSHLEAHSFITKLLNRNYVKPELNTILTDLSKNYKVENSNLKVIYLDANFPFFNGFPLLPHLSHNDGKKIDISFIYKNKNDIITNQKPSVSGYGIFVEPSLNESNQTKECLKKGYWQYDFTKHLTFGTIDKNLHLSEKETSKLIKYIIKHKKVHKLFIEPHLNKRFNIHNDKIRFHGCRAVRHDDHIHFQIN
jgi:hypothetical protein